MKIKNYIEALNKIINIKLFYNLLFFFILGTSIHFNLNNAQVKYGIIYDDIFYFLILNIVLVFISIKNIKKKKIKFFYNNKINIFILFLISLNYLFFIRDINYLKLIIYFFPLLYIDELKEIFKSISFNKIIIFLKISLLCIIGLLIFESIIYYLYNITLENLFFNFDSYKYNNNLNKNNVALNENNFIGEIRENRLGFRGKIFLSNPISVFINSSLITILLLHFKKINRLYVIFLNFIIGLICKTRLIIVIPFFFFGKVDKSILKKNYKDYILYSLLIIISIFLIDYFIDLKKFELNQIFNSRFTFYYQFLTQYSNNYFELLIPKIDIIYINLDNYYTGPHSDFLYLTNKFGIILSFIFLFKIIYLLKKIGWLLIIILLISLFNGIIFNGLFWVTIYLIITYENFNSYTNNK